MHDFIPPFLFQAMIAAGLIALISGPLGSMMIWQRMANFGDAIAHSTLLGLSLSLLFHWNVYLGLVGTALLMAILLSLSAKKNALGQDSILVIIAQTALALGLVVAAFLQEKGVRVDLLNYLYGDILAIHTKDVWVILGTSLLGLVFLSAIWKKALSLSLQADLAQVEGVPVTQTRWCIIFLMAVVFAVAVKLIGVLLITTLFIIPAASARQFSRSPESMALWSAFFGVLSSMAGVILSYHLDTPTGPSIVLCASTLFLLSYLWRAYAPP